MTDEHKLMVDYFLIAIMLSSQDNHHCYNLQQLTVPSTTT